MSNRYKKVRNDILTGVLAIVFAVLYYLETYHFQLVENINTVDAAFFPRIVAVMIVLCSLTIIIRGYLVLRTIPKEERMVPKDEKSVAASGYLRLAGVSLVLLAAALLLKTLGFLLTMPWAMFLIFCIIETGGKRKYWLYAIISILGPIIIFLMFYYGFTTLLPMGFIKPYLLQIL